ncbi:MAG: glycosyl transferase [Acidimicrobiales bacterium]|nr:MAG: glycosyl transferase [Acidimicrobiales bacterium]
MNRPEESPGWSPEATGAPDPGEKDETEPSPRVLWLIKGLGPGGAERLLVEQASASAGTVEYRTAYLLPWKSHLVGELEARGVPVTCLQVSSTQDPRWMVRLGRLVDEFDPDVVHVHSPLLAAATRVLVRILGSRRPSLVTTEHNRWQRHRLPTRLVNRLTFPLDDASVAVSEDVRRSMSPRAALSTQVVHHGIDVAAVSSLRSARERTRAELGVAGEEFIVGCVANLRKEKAHEVLVDAARQVCAEDPRVRFVTVGQGPREAEFEGLLRRAGLGERFVHLGYRPDAARITSAFDTFTLASRHEGLPVAVMEALALGVPVVATEAGGLPEAVGTGPEAAGLLVPVDSPSELAEAILRVARDGDLRARLSTNASRRAQLFDARVSCERLERLYSELARARRNRARRGRRLAARSSSSR